MATYRTKPHSFCCLSGVDSNAIGTLLIAYGDPNAPHAQEDDIKLFLETAASLSIQRRDSIFDPNRIRLFLNSAPAPERRHYSYAIVLNVDSTTSEQQFFEEIYAFSLSLEETCPAVKFVITYERNDRFRSEFDMRKWCYVQFERHFYTRRFRRAVL